MPHQPLQKYEHLQGLHIEGAKKDIHDPCSEPAQLKGNIQQHGMHSGGINACVAWQICRHKAAPVAEGSGCVKMFECMYHGWQYGEQIQLPASLPASSTLQNSIPQKSQVLRRGVRNVGGNATVNWSYKDVDCVGRL